MSDTERDDLFLDLEATAAGGDLPMDGLLAELLGNWQDVDAAEPAAELAEAEVAEPAAVSVSALMDRILEMEPDPQPALVADAEAETAPEAFVDLEELSILPVETAPGPESPVLEPLPEPEPEPEPAAVLPEPEPVAVIEPEDPTDDGALRLLLGAMRREFSESLAPIEPAPAAQRATERFLAFQLAGESFAVPLTRVLETERMPKRTNVPGLPAFVMGVANLRGAVLPLVDLGALLELDSGGRPHDARILVVRPAPDDTPVALVVDALQGVALLAREELHRTPHWLDSRTTPYLEGIGSHKGRLLSVLDLDRVFAASELREQTAAY